MPARIIRAARPIVFFILLLLAALAPVALPATAPSVRAQSVTNKVAPALLTLMTANPSQMLPVIVEVNEATAPFTTGVNVTLAQQALTTLQAYGQPVGPLPIVDGAAGWANAAGINAMSALSQVSEIDLDATVQPQKPSTIESTNYAATTLGSMDVQEVNGNQVWSQGDSGQGITVAVLDSGVNNDPDLVKLSNRILARASFAGPRNPNMLDPGGHGTHIAGIIAGDGTNSAGQFVGVAPRANIVDVQVLDANGNGRVSSTLAGLTWVLTNQSAYNIRVVNLSFGAIPQGSYITDPMAAGVEIAWRRGLVVVVAAGNGGPSTGNVDTPGVDPYAITVGSTDDQGQLSLAYDLVGWWSSYGTPPNSTTKPDLVAPGRRVVSMYVPGSTLSTLLPSHLVTANNGSTYFRMTGTSMSTAVVSGAVALLLQHQRGLTPDQVKKILTSTTQPFGQSEPTPPSGSFGTGLLNALAATNGSANGLANIGLIPSNDFAETLYPAIYGQPPAWKNPTYLGIAWTTLTWATLSWTAPAWNNYVWDNVVWNSVAWNNIAWDNIAWDNIAWDQSGWDDIAWDNIVWD